MGNIEITKKFSRLKSVSSIDDDYLETPPEVFYRKSCSLFFFQYLQKKDCVGVLFNKVAGLHVY